MYAIGPLFQQINDDASAAHLAHLGTRSYEEHVALGTFYENVREKMDTLLEAMISLGAPVSEPSDPLAVFKEAYEDLRKQRNAATGGNCVLEMHYDEMLNCYLKVIYMLRLK